MTGFSKNELLELAPDNCKHCSRVNVAAAIMALAVEDGKIGKEDAMEAYQNMQDPDCTGPPPACSSAICSHNKGERFLFNAAATYS